MGARVESAASRAIESRRVLHSARAAAIARRADAAPMIASSGAALAVRRSTTPRRAPCEFAPADDVHVGEMLVREPGTHDVEHHEVPGRDRARILAPLLVLIEWTFLRVGRGVGARERRHERVGDELHRVAAHDVTLEEPLSDEDGVVERVVGVGHVELGETPTDLCEDHRCAAHADPVGIGADPEDRIGRRDDELGRRRGHGRLGARARAHEQQKWKRRQSRAHPTIYHPRAATSATPAMRRSTSSSEV